LRLVLRSGESATAWRLLRRFEAPYLVTPYLALQLEIGLHRLRYDRAVPATVSHDALREWRSCLLEGVFQPYAPDFNEALQQARRWNADAESSPPNVSELLHPATAVCFGFTHFCSFAPDSRNLAKAQGLELVPATLAAL
jgi:hypothetical protein